MKIESHVQTMKGREATNSKVAINYHMLISKGTFEPTTAVETCVFTETYYLRCEPWLLTVSKLFMVR